MKSLLLGIFLVFFLSACDQKTEEKTSSEEKTQKAIQFSGSDTEIVLVKDLIEHFKKQNPDFSADISGGGSQLGIERFINGQIDVLNSSRQMESYEIKNAKKHNVKPVPTVFAIDAVAFVTNPYLGVDSLSIFDLGKIYRGEITNWKEVNGPDLDITVYGRNINSGTYSYVWQRIVQEEYAGTMKEMEHNSEIIEAVKQDTSGIGYVGVGYIMDTTGLPSKEIWAINVYVEGGQAFSPYEIEAIKSGDYPMVRPLFQYFNGAPTGPLAQYLDFILSEEGQKLVRKNNYFPISENYQIFNQQNENSENLPPLIGMRK